MASSIQALLALEGALSAAEIRRRMGISAATLSRQVRAAAPAVLRLGRARATRYALARRIRELPVRLPVYRIDDQGQPRPVAALVPVAPRGSWLEPAGHLFAGLPPVVVDMAPAGYLGRRFPEQHPELELPARVQDWGDDHCLLALAKRGEDVPGDLIIGDESLDRFLASRPREVDDRDYPALAAASSRGGAGSSAAGEHPKFTALRGGRHHLVKFTPGDGSASDERWRDLLVCEALALGALRSSGISAAEARIIDAGSRRFLEVIRFDRVGLLGRRGVISMGPLDDDLFGRRDSWGEGAQRLLEAGLLGETDARSLRLLEAFAILISNGDRHFGNVSFFAGGLAPRPGLLLAPAYDMLPMDAAPRAGELPPLPADEPRPLARLLDVWPEARAIAEKFWSSVAADPRIGQAFREQAGRRR